MYNRNQIFLIKENNRLKPTNKSLDKAFIRFRINIMFWNRMRRGRAWGRPEMCVCARCGYKEAKVPGIPCRSKKCPKCGIPLIRGS